MLYIHTTLVNSEFLCVLVVFITVYLVHIISLAINLSLSLSKWGGGERWNNSPSISGRGKEGLLLRMRAVFPLTSRTPSWNRSQLVIVNDSSITQGTKHKCSSQHRAGSKYCNDYSAHGDGIM